MWRVIVVYIVIALAYITYRNWKVGLSLALVLVVGVLLYNCPRVFLTEKEAASVVAVEAWHNYGSEEAVRIDDPDTVAWLADTFAGDRFHRSGRSVGTVDYYRLTFLDSEGSTVAVLSLPRGFSQLATTLFFYENAAGESYQDVNDYLKELLGI